MTPNIAVFKYPLGVIRIVEFILIVLAIAAVNSWSATIDYTCTTPSNITAHKVEAHTFTLSNVKWEPCNTTTPQSDLPLWTSDNNSGGSAGFFYFVNVVALIYVLLITFVYVILWDMYQNEKRLALLDLAITALLFVLFFFCSSIWWAGANNIGRSTGEEEITKLLSSQIPEAKLDHRSANNGNLAISVLCDWGCVLLFAFNCWFVWKEIVPREAENPNEIA